MRGLLQRMELLTIAVRRWRHARFRRRLPQERVHSLMALSRGARSPGAAGRRLRQGGCRNPVQAMDPGWQAGRDMFLWQAL